MAAGPTQEQTAMPLSYIGFWALARHGIVPSGIERPGMQSWHGVARYSHAQLLPIFLPHSTRMVWHGLGREPHPEWHGAWCSTCLGMACCQCVSTMGGKAMRVAA
ncbi:hypothetical protein HAX54_039719 [Datura stramonium]|uniref:Uncharacterized protein n=1 Tax=Datura stramonium TaxID=4076 RepID=A0ABS8SJL3_DATST|nr:hypothetical protein [Datura stramonium]